MAGKGDKASREQRERTSKRPRTVRAARSGRLWDRGEFAALKARLAKRFAPRRGRHEDVPITTYADAPRFLVCRTADASDDELSTVSVQVPERDVRLVEAVGHILRAAQEGDEIAQSVRRSLDDFVFTHHARTGRDLVTFFQRSPLADVDVERDPDTGNPVEL